MKFFVYKLIMLIMVLALIATSCQKESDSIEEEVPIVSISADQSFDSDNRAKLVVTLSASTSENVEIRLASGDVQSGKLKVPVDYSKKITIPAGTTNATIEVEADVLGLESGEYQAAIKIESADGVKIGENSVVYINFMYAFKPEVNLYADASFSNDKSAKVTITLSKAASEPVVVTLETDTESEVEAEYGETISIPAGETEVEVEVTVIVPDDIEPGIYPFILNISSVENGIAGPVQSIKINLGYPFSVSIVMDGEFDDWDDPNILSWSLPEGEVMYQSIKELKLTANNKYVYAYLEFEDPGFDFNMPFNMYIDSDGDPTTGAIVSSVDNETFYPPYDENQMGLEYYIELGLHDVDDYNDFYSWGGVYKYEGEHGENVFSGLTNLSGTYEDDVIFAIGSLNNNIGRIEIRLLRSWFGIKGEKVRIAVKNMDGDNNWAAYGLLPQGNVKNGERQHVDMATLYLPAFEE